MNEHKICLRPHRGQIGVTSSLECALRFLQWAEAQRQPLTWRAVASHLGCSRATAYRWINGYNAARAVVNAGAERAA